VEDMNHYEFSATKTQINQWDKIASSLIEYLSDAHMPGTVAARLYGRSYEDDLPTVLFYVDTDAETKLDKTLIPTLISPWHHWIIMPNKQVELGTRKTVLGRSSTVRIYILVLPSEDRRNLVREHLEDTAS
jgi:hypothetical protein